MIDETLNLETEDGINEVVYSPDQKILRGIDKYFQVSKLSSSIKDELIAGITTFFAMCYIIVLNSIQLQEPGTYLRTPALILATCLSCTLGTALIALWAKKPFGLGPGLSLSSMCIPLLSLSDQWGAPKISFGNIMVISFFSGIIFVLLCVIPGGESKTLQKKILDDIPACIKNSLPVGIGLFISFVGLKNAKIIVFDWISFIGLVDFSNFYRGGDASQALVCIFSFFVISVLSHFNVNGSIIIGILVGTVLALFLGVAHFGDLGGNDLVSWAFWENFAGMFSINDEDRGSFLMILNGFGSLSGSNFFIVLVNSVTFALIMLFDSIGTSLACCTKAGLIDEEGNPLDFNRIMYSNSVATIGASIFGTTPIIPFLESCAGIANGAKTGFSSLVISVLFLLSIFILPIFAFIPSCAASSALIYIGVLMISNVTKIDFSDIRDSVPAFLTIVCMPFTSSITKGIGIGLIFYVAIAVSIFLIELFRLKVLGREIDQPRWSVSIVTIVLSIFFLVYLLYPVN